MHSYSWPLWYRTLLSRVVGAAGATVAGATGVGAAAGATVAGVMAVGAIAAGSASGSAFRPSVSTEHRPIIRLPTLDTRPHLRQSTSNRQFTSRPHPRQSTK